MPVSDASSSQTSATGNPLRNPSFLTAPQAIFPGLRAQGVLALGNRGVLITRSADIAAVLTHPEVFSSEIAGCPVRTGQLVAALLGAANTDEEAIPDPDVVRFDRSVNRHIAFGRGIHRCLGSHLARLELRIALREWHARVPDYRVPPGFQPAFTSAIRSLATLPLQLGPSA